MPYPEAVALSEDERDHVRLVSGSTYPELAKEIASVMGTELAAIENKQFANSEVYSRFLVSARGKHVIAIQSLAACEGWSINDGIMQLAFMASAARGASAHEITAVMPHLAYARQDRKAKGREPLSIQAILDFMAVCGVSRIVTVDPHAPQVQLAHHGPFDQLTAEPLLQTELTKEILAHERDYVIVAPDAGRADVAEDYSHSLSDRTDAERVGRYIGYRIMGKRRLPDGTIKHTAPKGIKGKNCIVVDDMIDTAGTLVSATNKLHEAGAKRIVVAATHGLFSGEALSRIKESKIKQVIVTNTVPTDRAQEILGSERLRVVSIAPLIGQALFEIATNGSVSKIFDHSTQYR
jgi:ribose-phosphate pyrophosphokinase